MGNPLWLVENYTGYKHVISWRNRLVAKDDECNCVMSFEQRILEKHITKAYFKEDGFCLKLLGMKHWSFEY